MDVRAERSDALPSVGNNARPHSSRRQIKAGEKAGKANRPTQKIKDKQ
jgi:hypothetical protein